MKKVCIIFSCTLLAIACGNPGGTKSDGKDSAATSTISAADQKGLELIGASDCTTCHKLHPGDPGINTGPAYSDVAKKYAPAADSTVDRLVKKIITGGYGLWGTVPMTPHPALAETDVKEMVKFILTLKQ